MTRTAGLHDLRFIRPKVHLRFGMPAGEGEEEEQNEDTLPSDTDSNSTPADDTDDQDDEDANDDAPVRDKKLFELSQENKKQRHATKRERDRAEGLQERVSTLMLENAFIKAAVGRVSDFDAALKLMDRTGITITPEGEVTGVDEALAKVIERYPYVADEDAPGDTDLNTALAGLQASGRPANGKRTSVGATNSKVLRDKFPALRRLR